MKTPAQCAQAVEDRPVLPPGDGERVSGYGVMGLPFASGHALGLRRWTASSVGDRFTSIWHRDPSGRWTFYESTASEVACTRYFGADVERVQEGPIDLAWEASNRVRVRTADGAVDWHIAIGANTATRMMSAMGSIVPLVGLAVRAGAQSHGSDGRTSAQRREGAAHRHHIKPPALRCEPPAHLVRHREPRGRRG